MPFNNDPFAGLLPQPMPMGSPQGQPQIRLSPSMYMQEQVGRMPYGHGRDMNAPMMQPQMGAQGELPPPDVIPPPLPARPDVDLRLLDQKFRELAMSLHQQNDFAPGGRELRSNDMMTGGLTPMRAPAARAMPPQMHDIMAQLMTGR